ncbi:hypothetical protein P9250_29255 [Caballeronia sp. LP006]|uniref:hypothetical protein n=1 Tax=Caballeronia sp. LP006 TaxID=3038552 RepID=UPI002860FE51|nr:hypothetical protein [Caballeronia sp. LP006]MDR5831955.1 hypothetical protein [Caballeronia sp. LP006]
MSSHSNNFALLRLIAALMVLFAHQFALLGQHAPALGRRFEPRALASTCFFRFADTFRAKLDVGPARMAVYPKTRPENLAALPLTTVVCVFVLGTLVSTLPASAYFASPYTYEYLSRLRLRSSLDLPGVFADLPFPRAVNGSLWSIPLEVHWYLILLLLALVGIMRYRWLIVAMTFCFAVFLYARERVSSKPVALQKSNTALFMEAVSLSQSCQESEMAMLDKLARRARERTHRSDTRE